MTKEFIEEQLKLGKSLMEISKEYGFAYWKLYDISRKYGLRSKAQGKSKTTLDYHKNRRKFTDKLREDVIAKYKTGMSMAKIAKEYDSDASVIWQILHDNKISTRLKNGKNELSYPLSKEELYKEYWENGLSISEINRKYNTRNTQNRLKEWGIARRTNRESLKQKYITDPDFYRRSVEASLLVDRSNRRPTWIESSFIDWCVENNIEYKFQYQIVPKTHRFDFWLVSTNILVELDGVFWHDTDKSRMDDVKFVEFAIEKGYRVIRITDVSLKRRGWLEFEDHVRPLLRDNKI